MNALRRQLSATAWQAVGFFGASLVFALVVFLWGQHIEGRIDTVVVQRQRDHQTLHRLAIGEGEAVARELQANSRSGQELGVGSDGGEAPGSTGGGEAVAPSHPDAQPKSPGHPAAPPVHQPDNSGSEGGSAPVPQPAPQVSTSPSEQSTTPEGSPPATTEPRHESVLESAGATVGEVVKGAGGTLESATCGLIAPLLCPKP